MLRSILFAIGLISASSASAALSPGSFGPRSSPGVEATPAFGALVANGALAANYIDFGVDFTFGGVEGYFSDTDIFAFGGINAAGDLDLLSPVDGRIVIAGTTTSATTNAVFVEAGFAEPGLLTLSVFDRNNVLIASVVNGVALGINSRSLLSISAPGIASFSISGVDTFGVAQIGFGTAAIVPEPATWMLLIGGFALVGQAQRRRRAVTLTPCPTRGGHG